VQKSSASTGHQGPEGDRSDVEGKHATSLEINSYQIRTKQGVFALQEWVAVACVNMASHITSCFQKRKHIDLSGDCSTLTRKEVLCLIQLLEALRDYHQSFFQGLNFNENRQNIRGTDPFMAGFCFPTAIQDLYLLPGLLPTTTV
jgi:hypothetical protein